MGSDFSLTGQDVDLEMDYYDYNVVNAGAAPGSYLGMDPAFLVWIPPLDDSGEILPDDEKDYHEMEAILPKQHLDPGSNTESPEEELLLPKRGRRLATGSSSVKAVHHLKTDSDSSKTDCEIIPLISDDRKKLSVAIQLHEFPKTGVIRQKSGEENEKETKVEKSPITDSNKMDDIKYADDDEDDLDTQMGNQCNIELPYQDSNILSSN